MRDAYITFVGKLMGRVT